MVEIEFVVTADSVEDARKALCSVGLNDTELQSIGSFFITQVSFDEEPSDEFYEKIEGSEAISIVKDSSSQKRGEEIARDLYLVESHLRRILLHIPDMAETYLDIIVEKATHYRGGTKISRKRSLDTITSQLTLGQIIEIFEYNTSMQSNESLTWGKLSNILNDTVTIAALKEKIELELEPVTVWDVISKHVLQRPIELPEISGKLFKLKSIRDTAAHYRVVTQKDSKEALFLSKSLISELEIKQLSIDDKAAIRVIDEKASDLIKDSDMMNGGYPSNLADAPIDSVVDPWGMYNRESVSYAAWKVYQTYGRMPYWGGRGNANQWPANARAEGIATGSSPKAGSVAILMDGYYGHAMWVEQVMPDGQVRVSHYNYNLSGAYSEIIIPANGPMYIYFDEM